MLDPRCLARTKGSALRITMHDRCGGALSLACAANAENGIDPDYEVVVDGPAGRVVLTRLELDDPRTVPCRSNFASVAYLHLDPTAMTRACSTREPRMLADGSGLASMLTWLGEVKPDVLRDIATDLARVIPGVRRILTHRECLVAHEVDMIDLDQPMSKLGDRFSIEFDDGTQVSADLLGDGTVLALGLLAKLHEPERPRVLLLDDIDRGLHIGAQARLVAVFRDLMQHDPELQIICTTHSAHLLDLFEPSEVRVLGLDANRVTHAKPLTAHPKFGDWRYGTQTGELWVALGDGWVTDSPEDPAP